MSIFGRQCSVQLINCTFYASSKKINKMQHFKITLLIFCFASLISCSKEKPKSFAELIVGKWNLVNQVYVEKSTNDSQSENFESGSTLEFTSGGTVVIRIDLDTNGTIESDEVDTVEYTIQNSTLNFGAPISESYEITKLTTTELSLTNDGGDYTATINLKR